MILRDVKKNKTKTIFIVLCFSLFITLFVYFLSLWLSDGNTYLAITIGLSFSLISSFFSYYYSDTLVISMNRARPANNNEHKQLIDSLEGLCLAAGLPLPKLYVMDDKSMNAFATGRNPNHAAVCVTTGLLNSLDKYELEGVLAHELSHIKNYDILVSTIAVVMVGFVSVLSDAFARGFFFRNSDDDDNSNPILMIIGLVFIILAPISATLLQLTISRNREYLADASSVEITRNKEGLISALKKISGDNISTKCNKATASMFIASPFKGKEKDSLWSTHPATTNRIAKLEQIN